MESQPTETPQQLSTALELIQPVWWFAFAIITLCVAGILGWSIFSEIPVYAPGSGILLRSGGVFSIPSLSTGQIKKLMIQVGDRVKKNQIIAYINQPEIKSEIKELQSESIRLQSMTQNHRENTELKLDVVKRDLALKKESLKYSSEIRSPYSGHIIELLVNEGNLIEKGDSVAYLELSNHDQRPTLDAIVYIPSNLGKQIQKGMQVYIAPTVTTPERDGYMVGTVNSISEFPATRQGMVRLLGNEETANQIMQNLSYYSAPYEVTVALKLNANNFSRYEWTHPNGPPIQLQSGTFCAAKIVFERRHPIDFIFPQLFK